MKSIWVKIAGAVIGVALIGGVGAAVAFDEVGTAGPIELSAVSDDATSEPADPTPADPGPTDPAPADAVDPASIGEAEARRLAVEEVGGGQAVHIRADRDDGRSEWEVLVRDADDRLVEVTLDAADGRVMEVDVEDDDDEDHRGSVAAAATVSAQEAGELALEAVGGGEVLQVSADEDDGRPEWDVDVADADGRLVDVTIDATDGRVLEVDTDD